MRTRVRVAAAPFRLCKLQRFRGDWRIQAAVTVEYLGHILARGQPEKAANIMSQVAPGEDCCCTAGGRPWNGVDCTQSHLQDALRMQGEGLVMQRRSRESHIAAQKDGDAASAPTSGTKFN